MNNYIAFLVYILLICGPSASQTLGSRIPNLVTLSGSPQELFIAGNKIYAFGKDKDQIVSISRQDVVTKHPLPVSLNDPQAILPLGDQRFLVVDRYPEYLKIRLRFLKETPEGSLKYY